MLRYLLRKLRPTQRKELSAAWHPGNSLFDDKTRSKEFQSQLEYYLRHGLEFNSYLTRYEMEGDPSVSWRAGWYTDGDWVWSDMFAHFVIDHNLRFPQRFSDHMRQNEFKIPAKAEIFVQGVERDYFNEVQFSPGLFPRTDLEVTLGLIEDLSYFERWLRNPDEMDQIDYS